jgi:hypothetical protein
VRVIQLLLMAKSKSSVAVRSPKEKKSQPMLTVSVSQEVSVESKDTKRYRALIPQIEKRDGRVGSFSFEKIVSAVQKAMNAANEGSYEEAEMVAHQVAKEI